MTSTFTYALGSPAMNLLTDVSDPNVSSNWSVSGDSGTCNLDTFSPSVAKISGAASDTSIFSWSETDNNNQNVHWSATDAQYIGTYTVTMTAYSGCESKAFSYTVNIVAANGCSTDTLTIDPNVFTTTVLTYDLYNTAGIFTF